MKLFNWGILGCSTIAPSFIMGLNYLKEAKVLAVGSRNLERAKQFAKKNKILRYYGSYEELVKNKDIDIIYISTTNDLHKENIILCLNNGKHVLCEKPLTLNYKDTQEVINLAKRKNLFLMEALWTIFLPSFVKLKSILKNKLIGDIKFIRADFGFTNSWGIERRLLNKNLGGGTLMDNGIYPISLASMVFRKQPNQIETVTYIGKTGVDEMSSYLFYYDSGEIANLSSAIKLFTPQNALLVGTKGHIFLPDFWHGNKIIINLNNNKSRIINLPFKSTGYNYEAQEVMDCLKDGKKESEILPLNETLKLAKTMEQIRYKWKSKTKASFIIGEI